MQLRILFLILVMVSCIACGKSFSQQKGLTNHQRYCQRGFTLLAEGLESRKRRQEERARATVEKEVAEKVPRRAEGDEAVRQRQILRDAREIQVSEN